MKYRKLFKRALPMSALLVVTPIAAIACSNSNSNSNAYIGLQTYMANAWMASSAEKMATAMTTFRTAKLLFDAVLSDVETQAGNFLNTSNEGVAGAGYEIAPVVTATDYATSVGKNNTIAFPEIPVVWIDLDETVLDNTPYQVGNALRNGQFDADSWTNGVSTAQSVVYPGVIEFVEYVYANGGVVLFNSSRNLYTEREGTEKALTQFGFREEFVAEPVWWMAGVHVENPEQPDFGKGIIPYISEKYGYDATPAQQELATVAASRKEARAQYINDMTNYQIVMRIGDDINDFNTFATNGKTSAQRREIVLGPLNQLWGQSAREVRYKPDSTLITNTTSTAGDGFIASFEAYLQIGTNPIYGSWESALAQNGNSLSAEQRRAAREAGMQPYGMPPWDGSDQWQGIVDRLESDDPEYANMAELLGIVFIPNPA